MLTTLLSHDLPRSRGLALLLSAIVLALAVAPFVPSGAPAVDLAATVLVFIVLGASFDLLWGYTGFMTHAHAMFFGIGAYGVALAGAHLGPGWGTVALGAALALATSVLLSLLAGLLGWRANAVVFAGITLAMALGSCALVSWLPELTGGEGGVPFELPFALRAQTLHANAPFLGAAIDGRFARYGLLFCTALTLFLALLRIANSPFGRALQATRENRFLAEAIGYRTGTYRTLANMLSAAFATLAGVMLALWRGHTGPEAARMFEIMFEVLLIVWIGGKGTVYGAVVGSALVVPGERLLSGLAEVAGPALGAAFHGTPAVWEFATAHRGLSWLAALLVVAACPSPAGVVGRWRERRRPRRRPESV